MRRKMFVVYATLITAAMGAVIGYGVSTKNALLPVAAFITGIALIALGRRKVNEVVEDERIYKISEKASRRVYQIFTLTASLTGVTLIAMNEHVEVGYTLAFSACALMILYMILYGYYSRKSLD